MVSSLPCGSAIMRASLRACARSSGVCCARASRRSASASSTARWARRSPIAMSSAARMLVSSVLGVMLSLLLLVQLDPPVRPACCGSFHPVAVDCEIHHVVTPVCQAVAFKSPHEFELSLPPPRMNLAPAEYFVAIDLFDREVIRAVELRL